MDYRIIPSPPILRDYVRYFWVLESNAPAYIHRSMAEVCYEMVFHYRGRFDELKDITVEKSFLAGFQTPSANIRRFSISQSFGIFGVYLYPYVLPLATRVCGSELNGQMVSLGDLFKQEGSDLEERILLATDTRERIQLVSDFLIGKVTKLDVRSHPVFDAVRAILGSRTDRRIQELAYESCISERQLERKFRQFTGFTPKLFSRIARFQRMMQGAQFPSMTFASMAYQFGYCDQSHFIHEFKQFSGYYPSEFFMEDAEGKILNTEG